MAVTTQSVAQPVFSLVVLVSVLNLSPWMVGVDNHFSYCESVKTAVIPSVQSGLARLSHCGIASGDTELSFNFYYCCFNYLDLLTIYLPYSTCFCKTKCFSSQVCTNSCFCSRNKVISSINLYNLCVKIAKAALYSLCQGNHTSSGGRNTVESKYGCAEEVNWSESDIGRNSSLGLFIEPEKCEFDLTCFHLSMIYKI